MGNVVITGGSRGIGAATVELFAARGDRVTFLYEKNHTAAKAVADKTGAAAICCDVADGEAVNRAFSQIGDVDILVCNAGTMYFGLLSQMAEDEWNRLFAVNVGGIYHCVNAAMPSFLKTHRGSIVTVASMWGQVGASCEAAYSATKGAVIALTKALAKELGPSGIRVNCVAPGSHSDGHVRERRPEYPRGNGGGNALGAQRYAHGCGKSHRVSGRRGICHRTGAGRQRRVCDLTTVIQRRS